MASRARARPQRSWFGRIVRWLFWTLFVFVVGSILWVLAYRFVNPPITFTMISDMTAGRGAVRQWMSIDRIDRDMVSAAVAAEDSKFCTHWGFDQDAIAAAMRRNAQGGRTIRGGSTISQQTAKNVFLWQGGGYFRKALEAWFTLLIENLWGKQRIMEVYLNVAETGLGTYGVNAGSQRYFNHDASSMTRQEAARIAAILPLPKRREAVAPTGFTRRYGGAVAARLAVVQRDGLDSCVYRGGTAPAASPEEAQPVRRRPTSQRPQREAPVPGEEFERPQAAPPPDEPEPEPQPEPETEPGADPEPAP
jgi:monofunctional biosynthetic peptidoglycan transglycosylase